MQDVNDKENYRGYSVYMELYVLYAQLFWKYKTVLRT